jgi:hypothetical protein
LFFPMRVITYIWSHPIYFTLLWPVFSSSYFTLLQKLKILYNTTMKITNKIRFGVLIYYSKSALHVSGDVFAHHQEHLTLFTVSGSVQPSCCRLVSRMSSNDVSTH